MNGALALFQRGSDELSFFTRIHLSTRKLCNLVNFLKWINFISAGNMNLAYDNSSRHWTDASGRQISDHVGRDKAAKALNEFGVTNIFCTVVHHRIQDRFSSKDLKCKGDGDLLTLGQKKENAKSISTTSMNVLINSSEGSWIRTSSWRSIV